MLEVVFLSRFFDFFRFNFFLSRLTAIYVVRTNTLIYGISRFQFSTRTRATVSDERVIFLGKNLVTGKLYSPRTYFTYKTRTYLCTKYLLCKYDGRIYIFVFKSRYKYASFEYIHYRYYSCGIIIA